MANQNVSDAVPANYQGQDITRLKGENAWLSNFWPCKITYEGEVYNSVEAAYQAAKCVLPTERLMIQRAPNAAFAKWAGKSVTLRKDWFQVRVEIMHDLLRKKFTDSLLRKKLLATGSVAIVEENQHGDRFWGRVDGEGTNMLGTLLMTVRSELQDQK